MKTRSVSGALDGARLGQVLPHEHLVTDYGQMTGSGQPVGDDLRQRCLEVLRDLRDLGVGTVVDCTPPGYGRDLELLRQLSQDSGVAVVASTGSFCEQWHAQPAGVESAPVDELTRRFVQELTAQDSPACGVIKVATSHGAMTPNEEKLLLAAAAAHRATAAPIVSHTTEGLGLEQLDLYAAEGVDLAAVLVSHVCSGAEPAEYAVEIARRGAYVGLDRIGHEAHDLDHWTSLVTRLHTAGVAHRVLLSHDSVQRFIGPEAISGHTFSDPTYLTRQFLPFLTRSGVSTEVQRLMTHDNPRRWLLREEDAR